MKRVYALSLLRQTASSPSGLLGVVIVFGMTGLALVVGVAGASLLPYDPLEQNVGPPLAPPSWEHLFGTDRLGRDVFSRILYSAPNDFLVSVTVISFAAITGMLFGSFVAFRSGLVEEALMRVTDVFLSLPAIVLAIATSVALGPGVTNMMYALMIVWWPPYSRVARGEALRIVQSTFIEAAVGSGLGTTRIIFKHVVPNIFSTIFVYATIDFGQVILVYSGLSYLGLSVRPPYPDWGEMVSSYKEFMVAAPWLPLFPGAVIALVVIGFGLLGDALRDAMGIRG